MSKDVIQKLQQEIEGFREEIKAQKVGRIFEVGDGIARISGLSEAMSQELVEIETEEGTVQGIVFNIEEDSVGVVVLGDFLKIKEGDIVRTTGTVFSVKVGENIIGRVINPLGESLDDRGPVFPDDSFVLYPVERVAPGVLDRKSVHTPLHTGIKMIDSMIPIGRGQRELILGDRQIGKTSLMIDAIIQQGREKKYSTPICVYVAVGQKESKVAKIIATLKEHDAMRYTIVVLASASSPAALWYLAPYVGCAIGEYFMDQGRDAVVIYDDLTKHAWAYRQLSLLLRRPPGREAYPGDIFYLHSRLLERAACLSEEKGGGSLTALPIVETQLGDISAYIPTNVISITDGQIYLESDLFNQGIKPSINVGLSVSRVGSAAQTKAMKKVAGRLRLDLAQFRELQAFVQFATELDEATRKRITRGQLLTQLLLQDELVPAPFEKQVVVLYAGINGYFDDVLRDQARKRGGEFLEYMEKVHEQDVLKPIRESGELAPEIEEKLKKAIDDFLKIRNPKSEIRNNT